MNEQANIELVRQGYDAFNKGDIQRLLGLFADDIEWELQEVEGIPFTGKRHGRDEVADFFRIMDECQEPQEFVADSYIAQDDQVVVLGHATFTVRATGATFSDDWCHVFGIANGKLASFKEFADTWQAVQAYRLQRADAGGEAQRPAMH